ncbi:MAG: baseplate J/gp47 family protein [Gallionella sp.]|nr:baseplate J/gp47 family protein [Gallionella sp.]MDD4958379.1 baseplate J/gp47 family protein [Gallionella sp.]
MSGFTAAPTGLIATIGVSGPVVPAFQDVLTGLQTFFQTIYGQDIYLGNDSQDGQLVGLLANAYNDLNATIVSTYQSFSPATAQGVGLSSVVKINNLTREAASNSSCPVVITGTAGTTITNGSVLDTSNNTWLLPSVVNLGSNTTVTVTATSVTPGPIAAPIGSLNRIGTPTQGWLSVTNVVAGAAGVAAEQDGALRNRQASSTALTAQTIAQAISGAVANLPGVQSVAFYENDTNVTNSIGIPANNIALVVVGGTASQICQAILDYKAPGIPTYGNTSAVVPDGQGVLHSVSYSVPTQEQVDVVVTLVPASNYTSADTANIQAAVSAYIQGLGTGSVVDWSRTLAIATQLGTASGANYSITALTLALNGGAAGTADLTLAFNQQPICPTTNVTVNT